MQFAFLQLIRVLFSLALFNLKYFTKNWKKAAYIFLWIAWLAKVPLYDAFVNILALFNIGAPKTLSYLFLASIDASFILSSVVLVVRSFLKTHDVIKNYKNYAQMQPQRFQGRLSDLTLPSEYQNDENQYRIRRLGGQAIIYSPLINTLLQHPKEQGSNWTDVQTTKNDRVKTYISKNAWFLKQYYVYLIVRNVTKNKAIMFDETKLCLSDDLIIRENKLCFSFHKGTYFESLLTNEMFNTYIFINDEKQFLFGHKSVLDRIKHVMSDSKDPLETISDLPFNNHIGGSILAITADNHLVLWRQSKHALIGSNQLVSTGSGSIDWGDYEKTNSVYAAVQRGMMRELVEESMNRMNKQGAVKDEEFDVYIADPVMIGYYRWYDRGGKPEFCGLCRLLMTVNDVRLSGSSVENNKTPLFIPVPTFETLLEKLDLLADSNDLSSLAPEVSASLSLRANALLVREWAAANPQAAQQYLAL